MRYLSVCSGIEAATVAWHPLGWEPVAFSEIEPFPSALLAHHYPHVPNLGDMTTIRESEVFRGAAIDLLVGGTPCQAFSLSGLRGGLADPRGNLALVFLGLVYAARPRWVVWENVPGVLSSNEGRDFGTFLGALGQLGYGFAYRVLDAQYFGVAQRRRRVFVVGSSRGWTRAAAVLFERDSLSGNPPPCRKARAGATGGDPVGLGADGIAHTLRGEGFDASEDGTGRGVPLVHSITLASDPISAADLAQPITQRNGDPGTIAGVMGVRHLTPRECERLQDFEDDYTLIPYRGKPAADGPRYKALGNSMAVPVMAWIGRRIHMIDQLELAESSGDRSDAR